VDVPTGPDDLSSLPERQHAWNEALPRDDHGNVVAPHHRVLLHLNYRQSGEPTDSHRETVETALRGVEHAYERSGDGLLLTVSYSYCRTEIFTTDVCREPILRRNFGSSGQPEFTYFCPAV
jgi:hypothetical protein